MADNVGYTPGYGVQIAADEIGGVLYQRAKLVIGDDGTAVDVSASNPIPVTLPSTILTALAAAATPTTQAVSGTITANMAIGGTSISSSNPLSVAITSGATTLSDTVLTDTSGTLFICRDNGVTLSYVNLSNGLTYTPSGSIQVADQLAMGADNTGVTQPASGLGVRGWLSGIYQKLSNTLPVSIASMPSTPVTGTFWPGTQPISGSVSVSNLPVTQAVSITSMPTTPVTGTVSITGTPAVSVTFPGTQPVSIASMPSTPVTIASLPALATGAATIGSVNILGGNTTAVKTDSSAVTQPVSIAAAITANIGTTNGIALESGHIASVDTKTPALGQALIGASVPVVLPLTQITTLAAPVVTGTVTANIGTTNGIALESGHIASVDTKTPALGQALAAASVPVVLTATQLATLAAPVLAAGSAAIGSVTVSNTITNSPQIGGSAISATNAVPMYDAYSVPWTTGVAPWTSATPVGTLQAFNTAGMDTVALTITPTSPITGGAITFEVYDGALWIPIKCARLSSYNTDSVFMLSGATQQGWTVPCAGYPQFRVRLSTAISGAGTIAISAIVSSAPDTSVVTAGLDPLQSQHPGVMTQTAAQVLAIGITSALSALTQLTTGRVILTATIDCWVNVGTVSITSPTAAAVTGSFFLPASCPSYPIAIPVPGTTKLAVISNTSATGYLSIFESI